MTAKKDRRVYLRDILSSIALIAEYTIDGKDVFLVDSKTQDAVLRQFSLIGEAAAKLSGATRTRYPEVPWKRMIGMRNVIIHEYSKVHIQRIWETIEQDVPQLQTTIEEMLRRTVE